MRPGAFYDKSQTVYGTVDDGDDNFGLNTGPSIEAYNPAHWTNYVFTYADVTGLGWYERTSINLPDGVYRFNFYKQKGGGPATSDAPPFWTETKQLTGGVWVESVPITIAKAVLTLDWTTITGEASRSLLNAVRFLRNKWSVVANPGNVRVYKEDDTTIAYEKPITTQTNTDGITSG